MLRALVSAAVWVAAIAALPLAVAAPGQPVQAALSQVLREQAVDARLQQLWNLGAQLPESAIPAMLKEAAGLKELRERMVLEQSALQHWGQLDPAAALAYVVRLPESQFKANTLRSIIASFAKSASRRAAAAAAGLPAGRSRSVAIDTVARAWAATDARAAWEWADQLPEGDAKRSAMDGVLYVWVHTDPEAASGEVARHRPGKTREDLSGDVAFYWAARDLQGAIRWATHLPEGTDKNAALASLAESWANRDPRRAAAFVLRLPPGAARVHAGAQVAWSWSKQEPRLAADWAWRCGDEGIRSRGIEKVLEIWAAVEPASARRWVAHLPAGPDGDQAIREFASDAAPWTPALAIRTAMRIEDEAMRLETIGELLPHWLQVDAPSAESWLRRSKLPEAMKAHWLSLASTASTR